MGMHKQAAIAAMGMHKQAAIAAMGMLLLLCMAALCVHPCRSCGSRITPTAINAHHVYLLAAG